MSELDSISEDLGLYQHLKEKLSPEDWSSVYQMITVGDADEQFLKRLDNDENLQQVVEDAYKIQSARFSSFIQALDGGEVLEDRVTTGGRVNASSQDSISNLVASMIPWGLAVVLLFGIGFYWAINKNSMSVADSELAVAQARVIQLNEELVDRKQQLTATNNQLNELKMVMLNHGELKHVSWPFDENYRPRVSITMKAGDADGKSIADLFTNLLGNDFSVTENNGSWTADGILSKEVFQCGLAVEDELLMPAHMNNDREKHMLLHTSARENYDRENQVFVERLILEAERLRDELERLKDERQKELREKDVVDRNVLEKD